MKWISPKERGALMVKLLRFLRMNRGFEEPLADREEIVHIGIPASKLNQDIKQSKNFNVQAYIFGNKRTHEIETQKAMLISLSRHERWKAGGPL